MRAMRMPTLRVLLLNSTELSPTLALWREKRVGIMRTRFRVSQYNLRAGSDKYVALYDRMG